MQRTTRILAAVALGGTTFTALLATGSPPAPPVNPVYEVTVTNLTGNQIMSPLLALTHGPGLALFTPGAPATPELAALAEDGDRAPLQAALAGAAGVGDVAGGAGLLFPGESETVELRAIGHARYLSLASMLVSTNDTFAGVDTVALPEGDAVLRLNAVAYDAGSEFNSEDCAFIPGPPCGSGGVHDPAPAEGSIHVSRGIQGVGNLAPEQFDWRNPVARVTVRRKR